MVEVAQFYMDFCREESCGKCVPCRTGTVQLYDLLTKIIKGQATERDLTQLAELSQMVKEMSLCGLGMTAPNPVMSTLDYFREEYTALLKA
jgi:bidirectional [NiFe] hydrogenase diaphorase subunit